MLLFLSMMQGFEFYMLLGGMFVLTAVLIILIDFFLQRRHARLTREADAYIERLERMESNR